MNASRLVTPPRAKAFGLALALLASLGAMAPAQEPAPPDPDNPVGENLQVPPDWHVRLDKADSDVVISEDRDNADIFFVNMTPGWHITTGPRAIFYHPGSTASGDFRAEASIHLFPPGERNEAFGLLFGGRELDEPGQAYDYFVIRNSGEFLIKRRNGEETSTIRPWTAHEAIVTYGPETRGTATNVLGLAVEGNEVAFLVNGSEVARLPRSEVRTDGLVGLRVNHHLNLHVSMLSVEANP